MMPITSLFEVASCSSEQIKSYLSSDGWKSEQEKLKKSYAESMPYPALKKSQNETLLALGSLLKKTWKSLFLDFTHADCKKSTEQLIENLYQLGHPHAFSRYYLFSQAIYGVEHITSVAGRVFRDFQGGIPHSFETIAEMLETGHLGNVKLGFSPFDREEESLFLISALAQMGVKRASQAMTRICVHNRIRHIRLVYPTPLRIKTLRLLADAGVSDAQRELGNIYTENHVGLSKAHLQPKERTQGLKHLASIEKEPNPTIDKAIETNLIGTIPYELSKEKRIQLLKERAKADNPYALRALLNLYIRGSMGERENKIDLKLSPRDRLKEISSLSSPLHQHMIDEILTRIYSRSKLQSAFVLSEHLSDQECVEWLRNAALSKNNFYAANVILDALKTGFIDHASKKKIAFKVSESDKAAYIQHLASRGNVTAMKILLKTSLSPEISDEYSPTLFVAGQLDIPPNALRASPALYYLAAVQKTYQSLQPIEPEAAVCISAKL